MKVTLNCITRPLIPVGDDVSVVMKPEEYIIYCARVSSDHRINNETAPKLLRYLIDQGHWSPFEMISIGIEIVTSRAIAQQLLRHRSFSFQEFSQRYAKVEAMEPVEYRMQAEENRQSSTDRFYGALTGVAGKHIEASQALYNQMLEAGIAKESARMILPLCTQTTIIMHGTLRSWIHFFGKRCDKDAQKEAQEIGYAARDLVAQVCPWTAKALDWNVTKEKDCNCGDPSCF